MCKSNRLIGFILCLIPCLAVCLFMSGFGASEVTKISQTPAAKEPTTIAMNKQEPIFACNVSALTKEERARYSLVKKQLMADKKEVKDLPDGYSFRFAANAQAIKDVAEFVTYERACCPFINFDMGVSGEDLSLKLSGPEGTKELLKEAFSF